MLYYKPVFIVVLLLARGDGESCTVADSISPTHACAKGALMEKVLPAPVNALQ